jgi:hypothetical protein
VRFALLTRPPSIFVWNRMLPASRSLMPTFHGAPPFGSGTRAPELKSNLTPFGPSFSVWHSGVALAAKPIYKPWLALIQILFLKKPYKRHKQY